MVQEHYVRRIREMEKAADEVRARLRTREDAERHVQAIREKIRQCFGPFPEKTPLNARLVRTSERTGYRIEHVIFESRPGFPVTANLYVPTGRPYPLPGVIGTCGHADAGKGGETYQAFAQSLARKGYVTLLFDPIGQGERMQHLDAHGNPVYPIGTGEHTYVGNRMVLTGEQLCSWFAWDGIRALDYLLTRPEVDPRHVGVTGNSGGGTQATWLLALDPRFTMAAPSCFITSMRHNLENETVGDPEQCPPRCLALGLDHADFIAAFAPKPVMILGQEKDFFDVRGLEQAYDRVRRIYRLLGVEDRVQLFVGNERHGFWQANREAMYGWFNRLTGSSEAAAELPVTLESPAQLWCCPQGRVSELQPTTVHSWCRDRGRALASLRPSFSEARLKIEVTGILRLPPRTAVPDYRILRPVRDRGYPKSFAAIYAIETEPGIQAMVYSLSNEAHVSRPLRGRSRALLYVAHQSADAEMRTESWLAKLALADADFFACDVRGIGESRPMLSCPDFPAWNGADYLHAAHGLMFDSPVAGQRTHDVLSVADWLSDGGYTEIHLVAAGWGTIPGVFAALLHPHVVQVTLHGAPDSLTALNDAEHTDWPLAAMVPGILERFDLPDCYRVLAAKSLNRIRSA